MLGKEELFSGLSRLRQERTVKYLKSIWDPRVCGVAIGGIWGTNWENLQ